MIVHEFPCPECGAKARSSKALPAGTAIRCRNCGHVYRVEADDAHDEPDIVATPAPPAPADEPPVVRAVRAVAVDDEDDRPRRRRRGERDDDDDRPARKKKSKSGNNPVMVLAGAAALLLIIGGVLVIGLFVYNSQTKDKTSVPVATGPGNIMFPGQQGGPEHPDYPWSPVLRGPDDAPSVQNPPADEKPAGAAADTRPLIGPPAPPAAEPPVAAGEPGEVIDSVKRATVYIRVTVDRGIGSGTGFFATGGKGLVVTNAHVVGMLEPDTKPPKNIDVILNSGLPDEATFHGEVLAVDRTHDLAVLRIKPTEAAKTAKLPDPLPVAADAKLHETQKVIVFGYPFGEQLGKTVTVSESTVTSLRRTPEGELQQIQVGGGMNPGNSGGPVVDAAGHIVGVSVAIIKGTGINFAIPAHRVRSILDGRLAEIHLGEPVPKNDKLSMAVEIDALDPQKHIKSPAVDWWWGEAKDKVPAAREARPKLPAAPEATVPLKLEKPDKPGHYVAEVSLPTAVPAGKVLWLQPHFTDEAGRPVFVRGVAKEVDPLPEPRPITLAFQPFKGTGKLSVKTRNNLSFHTAEGGSGRMQFDFTARLTETGDESPGDRGTTTHLAVGEGDTFDETNHLDGKSMPRQPELDTALKNVKKLTVDITTDRYGSLFRVVPAFGDAPPEMRHGLGALSAHLCRALDFASIPLPNGEVQPGQRWRTERPVPVTTGGEDVSLTASMACIYRGVRTVNGRQLAVVSVSGSLPSLGRPFDFGGPAIGPGGPITPPQTGTVSGTVLVDAATGRVVKATATMDSSMSSMMPGEHGFQPVRAHFRLDLTVTRE